MNKTKAMHHINMTYSGRGKYTVTWKGWANPNGVSKTVRKSIHTNYADTCEAATIAANLYAEWMQAGRNFRNGGKSKAIVELVTYAYVKADKTAVGVSINWESGL